MKYDRDPEIEMSSELVGRIARKASRLPVEAHIQDP